MIPEFMKKKLKNESGATIVGIPDACHGFESCEPFTECLASDIGRNQGLS